jgi:hypothetical protein
MSRAPLPGGFCYLGLPTRRFNVKKFGQNRNGLADGFRSKASIIFVSFDQKGDTSVG